jgi:hypothetical protein
MVSRGYAFVEYLDGDERTVMTVPPLKPMVDWIFDPETTEYWIPAEDLAEFNQNIVGQMAVVAEFR